MQVPYFPYAQPHPLIPPCCLGTRWCRLHRAMHAHLSINLSLPRPLVLSTQPPIQPHPLSSFLFRDALVQNASGYASPHQHLHPSCFLPPPRIHSTSPSVPSLLCRDALVQNASGYAAPAPTNASFLHRPPPDPSLAVQGCAGAECVGLRCASAQEGRPVPRCVRLLTLVLAGAQSVKCGTSCGGWLTMYAPAHTCPGRCAKREVPHFKCGTFG